MPRKQMKVNLRKWLEIWRIIETYVPNIDSTYSKLKLNKRMSKMKIVIYSFKRENLKIKLRSLKVDKIMIELKLLFYTRR